MPWKVLDMSWNGLGFCQGKVNMSQKLINHIGFILATDLKNFAESNGDFSKLTANEVYTHLLDNQ